MENIIYNELCMRGYSVDVGIVEIRELNESGNSVRKQIEVDFVVNRGSQRYYIQSAYALPSEEKVKQEERPLRAIPDSFKKIIIVKEDILPRRNEDGILMLGLRQFLLDEHSIEL
jgi:predicted AAA+ superfamily ATPase